MTDSSHSQEARQTPNSNSSSNYLGELLLNGDDLKEWFSDDGRNKFGGRLLKIYASKARENPMVWPKIEEIEGKMREKGMKVPKDSLGHQLGVAFKSWLFSSSAPNPMAAKISRQQISGRLI